MTQDEMVGWHHRCDGTEFEQALGFGDGQGKLTCYSPWGRKESDTTERLMFYGESNNRITEMLQACSGATEPKAKLQSKPKLQYFGHLV